MIVGRLQTRNWEAQDGSKRSKTEIVATDVNFIDRPKDGSGEFKPSESKEGRKEAPKDTKDKKEEKKEDEIDIEDIPF